MAHHPLNHVSSFSRSMLRRDFISLLLNKCLDHVAENILSYLDAKSLCSAELVSKEWYRVISEGMLWKKLIERRVRTDSLWKRLAERRGWIKYLFKPSPGEPRPDHTFYKGLYRAILQDIDIIESDWQWIGWHIPKIIEIQCEDLIGIFCVKYDDHKIVGGLGDGTIRIWDRNTLECIRVLTGHTGSVICLQFDDRVIISGSLDSTVRVWDVKTGELINTIHHGSTVHNLFFNNGRMVTRSGNRSITVWNMVSPSEISIQSVLVDHTDAVWAVDLDEKYIVTASDDRAIKVWNTATCELVRTLEGHKGRVTCLQCRDRLVVSGSLDNTIKLWDIESGACLRTLKGHELCVICIQFDSKRIVSADFGEMKVWDLAAALDPNAPAATLCLGTTRAHSFGVFSPQMDDFQIVCCSLNNIFIYDFLNATHSETPVMDRCGKDMEMEIQFNRMLGSILNIPNLAGFCGRNRGKDAKTKLLGRHIIGSDVRWLSKGVCFNRFWNLYDSWLKFLEENYFRANYVTLMNRPELSQDQLKLLRKIKVKVDEIHENALRCSRIVRTNFAAVERNDVSDQTAVERNVADVSVQTKVERNVADSSVHAAVERNVDDVSVQATVDRSFADASVQTGVEEGISCGEKSEKTGPEKIVEDVGKLWPNGDHTDVLLKVKDREFKAHRTILAARIPVLGAMFVHDTTEKASGEVNIEDCEPEIFEQLLNFIYKGAPSELTADNASALYVLADKYLVSEVKALCVRCMLDTLHLDTFCEILTLSLMHREDELLRTATDFLSRNMIDVMKSVQWQRFMREHPTWANEIQIRAMELIQARYEGKKELL